MDVIRFIETKKAGKAHAPDDIAAFIQGVMTGEIPDYQAAAWLMAVNFKGLDPDETVALTKAIVESGEIASYEGLPGPVVDKHSTGGVGDKVTLVLLPVLAEMGMYVPKHSGRALGFTGGTIDKLESIPGFNAFLPEERFRDVVEEVGFAIGGQGPAMCPADGILYALRDATATVGETGLIAASVMSKKIAGGANHILVDTKVGAGAFAKSVESARRLAERMAYVGKRLERDVRCMLTLMDQPLGRAVGNAIELREAVECLRGKGPADVMAICRAAAVELSMMSGLHDEESAARIFDEAITSGAALGRFRRFVSAQGGDVEWIDGERGLPPAARMIELKYQGDDAFIKSIDALLIGETVRRMGGGRLSKDDEIDHAVGIVLLVKVGDSVIAGDVLARLNLGPNSIDKDWKADVLKAYTFDDKEPKTPDIIIGMVPGS